MAILTLWNSKASTQQKKWLAEYRDNFQDVRKPSLMIQLTEDWHIEYVKNSENLVTQKSINSINEQMVYKINRHIAKHEVQMASKHEGKVTNPFKKYKSNT